ncbi:MAG: QueT transporter family protein [Acidobacteriota bacterium]
MRGLLRMFDHTKMIVLLSLTAGLYTSLLIPFKALVIIPGYVELRPAGTIPVVCSLFFGPAAAWGAAFGNLIGDFFGMLGVGSLFGMLGNFIYGYIPYRVWLQGKEASLTLKTARDWARYVVAVSAAALGCGVTIAWGLDVCGLVPFVAAANMIVLNNLVFCLILGPVIIKLLLPRLQAWGLLYQRIMGSNVGPAPRALHLVGLLLIYAGCLMALGYANLKFFTGSTFLDHALTVPILGHTFSLHAGITPGALLLFVGCILI